MVATSEALRYTEKHKPKVDINASSYCYAILSDGSICNRACNWVRDSYGGSDGTTFEGGFAGHWRHNPRPYRNH